VSVSEEFQAFEHAGWQTAAATYHRYWERLTAQSIPALLDAVAARPGARFLDIASGPGHIAAAAAERGADVTGVDFADNMISLARIAYPTVDFQLGDAIDLYLPAGSVDAAVMGFGMLHLSEPERAATEAFRVLRPGGGFAFSVWAMPAMARGFEIVLDAVRTFGNPDVSLPPGPPFFRYSAEAEARALLGDAGFVDITFEEIPQTWRLPGTSEFLLAFHGGTARTGPLLRAQTPAALELISAAVFDGLKQYQTHDGLAVPMPAVVVAGVKPAS
jgi:SAM-dependent methyltransferase